MSANGERRPLAHPVSDDARAGFAAFARETRLSAAVVTEAIGLALAAEMRRPRRNWSRWVRDVAADAEGIYDERHFGHSADLSD